VGAKLQQIAAYELQYFHIFQLPCNMRTLAFIIWALAAIVVAFADDDHNLRHRMGSDEFPEPGYPAPTYAPVGMNRYPIIVIPLSPTEQPTASTYYAP
jgi:hypothetical protein